MMPPPVAEYVAWVDGSGSVATGPAAIGVVVVADGVVVCEASAYIGAGSNNVAEVHAAGRALALVYAITRSRATRLTIRSDSAFTVGALAHGSAWVLRSNPALTHLALAVRAEVARWPHVRLVHVPGHAGIGLNPRADLLAGRARKAAVAAAAQEAKP